MTVIERIPREPLINDLYFGKDQPPITRSVGIREKITNGYKRIFGRSK